MVTDAEQDEQDERRRKIASAQVERTEHKVTTADSAVTWIKHTRPERAEVAEADAAPS